MTAQPGFIRQYQLTDVPVDTAEEAERKEKERNRNRLLAVGAVGASLVGGGLMASHMVNKSGILGKIGNAVDGGQGVIDSINGILAVPGQVKNAVVGGLVQGGVFVAQTATNAAKLPGQAVGWAGNQAESAYNSTIGQVDDKANDLAQGAENTFNNVTGEISDQANKAKETFENSPFGALTP